jgi:transcriptional regulator with XRE-family HTH domain
MRNLENKYPNKLRELRTARKLTLKQVAALLQLHNEGRLCRWERGQSTPSVMNLVKLCKVYKVQLDELY